MNNTGKIAFFVIGGIIVLIGIGLAVRSCIVGSTDPKALAPPDAGRG